MQAHGEMMYLNRAVEQWDMKGGSLFLNCLIQIASSSVNIYIEIKIGEN